MKESLFSGGAVGAAVLFAVVLLGAGIVYAADHTDAAQDIRARVIGALESNENTKFLSNSAFEALVDDLVAQLLVEEERQSSSYAIFEQAVLAGLSDEVELPSGAVSCFDRYEFDSVSVDVVPNTEQTVSGVPIVFSATISNSNPFPVVEGKLIARILRLDERDVLATGVGAEIVDEFVAQEDIGLSALGTHKTQFSWAVPSYANSGTYQLVTFFTSSDSFNLHGLAFTNHIVGSRTNFGVFAEREGVLRFDNAEVFLNSRPYRSEEIPPEVSSAEPVHVNAFVVNEAPEDARGTLTWEVYKWDAQNPENLISRKEEEIRVKRGERLPFSFSTTRALDPAYVVVGKVEWRDTTSLIHIRFVREGKGQIRTHFPSIDMFPIRKETPVELFSCVYNAGLSEVVGDVRIVMELEDERGRNIHTYEYEGDVTGAIMGLADDFVPTRGYDTVTLKTRIYQDAKLIEEVDVSYVCEDIDLETCLSPAEKKGEPLSGGYGQILVIIAGLVIMLVLVNKYMRSSTQSSESGLGASKKAVKKSK